MLTITLLKKHTEGRWQSEELDRLPSEISSDETLWIDAQDPTEVEIKELTEFFELDEQTIQELAKEGARSRIDENEDRIFCSLLYPKENFIAKGEMQSISMLVCSRWIITMHKGYSELTCNVFKKIATHGYFSLSLIPSTDIMLYILLDSALSEYFPVSDSAFENIEALNREAGSFFRDRSGQVNRGFIGKVVNLRDKLFSLRQSLSPFLEIISRITRGEFALIQGVNLPRFGNLYDKTIQLVELVNAHREEMNNLRDVLVNVQTVTTNNIIRILTIISAIFLPLTLIAGLYGTNFPRGVPEISSPIGFYILIIVMIVIALSLALLFKLRKWF